MPLAELLAGRRRPAGRLPGQIDDLHGPAGGVITLPRHLACPGLRECDVADEQSRRSLYGMLLARGTREDILRLINGALLRQDWPLIKPSLEPRLGRRCERRLELG